LSNPSEQCKQDAQNQHHALTEASLAKNKQNCFWSAFFIGNNHGLVFFVGLNKYIKDFMPSCRMFNLVVMAACLQENSAKYSKVKKTCLKYMEYS
jgi:hypothetical protein